MSKSKTDPEWWIIKGEQHDGGKWVTLYVGNKRALTTDLRGAARYVSFVEATRDMWRIQNDWADTSDDMKWRLRVVGLRVKAAK